jgi:hypothetical protein
VSADDADPGRSVPEELWRQYQAWAATSRRGKSMHDRARAWAFGLGALGALLGAATAHLGEAYASIVATAAAVSVALAGYIGREFLVGTREPDWARARILAEALKRETWLYLMHVSPYAGSDRDERLLAVADGFQENVGLRRAPPEQGAPRPLPRADSLEDYLTQRVDDQIAYYAKAWSKEDRTLRRWRPAVLVLGTFGVVLAVGMSKDARLAAWIPVVTTLGTAMAAYLRSRRGEALLSLYQGAEHQLRLRRAAAGRAAQDPAPFVRACEEIMSRENQSWRAEWSRVPDEGANGKGEPGASTAQS